MMHLRATVSLVALAFGLASSAWALPQGGAVQSGQATFTQPDATTLHVNQTTANALLTWDTFNLTDTDAIYFNQPGTDSTTFNHITGGSVSQIHGRITAPGRVYLINPSGLLFGPNANVNVGSLVATTGTFQGTDITLPTLHTFNASGGAITNHGTITVAEGGLAALVAPSVANHGTITARLGRIMVAGAQTFTIDPYGDQLLTLAPTPASLNLTASNAGTLSASGGSIALTTQQTNNALASVVNTSGIVEANTFANQGGVITLGQAQGQTTVGGLIQANGTQPTDTAGAVRVIGNFVDVASGARLEAIAPAGGGSINVGGSYQGQGPLPNAERTRIGSNATLSTDATHNGNGGQLVVWADKSTLFSGHVSSRGGAQSGNGGLIEVSGKQNLAFNGTADTRAPDGQVGTLLLDPVNITITDAGPDADDGEVADFDVLEADGGGGSFSISEAALEALAGSTAITLQASNNLTIANLTDNTLTLGTTGLTTLQADSDADGNGAFSMDAGDSIVTAGALTIGGDTLTLGTLDTSLNVGQAITLNTTGSNGIITTNGAITTNNAGITANGALTLATDTDLTSSGGAVALNGATTGDFNLGILAGVGTISLQGTDNNSLILTSGGATTLQGTYTLDNALTFANVGAITLGGATIFNMTDGATRQNLTFGTTNSINGTQTLAITAANITLDGAIGVSTPLTSLNVNSNANLTLGNNITTTGAQSYTGTSALSTNGTFTTAANNVTFNSDVTLAGTTAVNSTGGAIHYSGKINGANDLTLNAGAGNITLADTVGNSTRPTTLSLTGSANSIRSVNTNSNQTYTGATSLNGTVNATGGTTTFNSAVTLTGASGIDTSGGNANASFVGTLDGAFAFTSAAGTGTTTFNADVGNSTPLTTFTATGNNAVLANLTTTGAQSYAGNLTLNGNLNAGTTISIPAALTLTGNSILTGGGTGTDNLSLSGGTTGAFTLEFVAGLADITLATTDIGTLTLTSADDLTLTANLLTDTALNFTAIDDINLTGTTQSITAGNGPGYADITMDSGNTLTGNGTTNVTLTGATNTLYGITSVNQLTATAATANTLNAAITGVGATTFNGPTTLNADITTSNANLTFTNAATLGANTILSTGSGAGDILFSSTLNGAFSLTATTGTGSFTNTGIIGGITPLTNLTLTSNLTTFNGAVTATGDIAINGTSAINAATTAGNDVLLTGNTILAAAIAATNDITILGDSTLNTGGSLNATNNIDITGNSTINTTTTFTAGNNLEHTGDIALNANLSLTSGGGAGEDITIAGDITGDNDLTFVAGTNGDINLTGTVDINRITFTSGADFNFGGGTILTDNEQNYTPLTLINLGGDTTMQATDGSTRANVTMGSANTVLATTTGVDLTVEGDTVTLYQIGDSGSGKLNTLTVNANTAQLLNDIYTLGAQTITANQGLAGLLSSGGGDVTLNTTATLIGDVTILSAGGNVFLNRELNGPYGLIIDAGIGDVFVNAALGASDALTTMIITANTINLSHNITTTGDQTYTGLTNMGAALTITEGNLTYNSPIILTNHVELNTTPGAGNITINSTVNGPYNLSLVADEGDITITGAVGTTSRLGSVNVTGGHNLTFTQGLMAENYYQRNLTGLSSFGYTPGLNVLGSIDLALTHDLDGKFTGTHITLLTTGHLSGEVIAGNGLNISAASSALYGSIAGETGRRAARRVTFMAFNGGPHTFGSYALPLVEDFYSPPTLQGSTLPASAQAISGFSYPVFTAMGTSLNPFTESHSLVALNDRAESYSNVVDVTSPLFTDTLLTETP